ncbi:MAG: hemerythrin domain-containing protein [Amaricoccus sp.]
MSDELALAARSGLPDPLRLLVERYPRIGWEAHPNFTALTRFWMDRHLSFRRMHAVLAEDTRRFLDRDAEARAYAGRLLPVAGRLIDELHGHHWIEDHEYFPMLQALDDRIGWGFDLLERDHEALGAVIDDLATATNGVRAAVRAADGADAAAARLESRIAALGRLLDRHLIDEEELVVPVILDHPEAGL